MNNFKDVIKDLQGNECLSDVTLVCNDDTQIKAHKFVLIGSSPVFRSMLLHSSQRDTILYLRGVKRSELEWALQLMYLGQTQIPHTQLQSFIELANDFKMKGIYNENEEQNSENINEKATAPKVYRSGDMERNMDELEELELEDEELEISEEREEPESKAENVESRNFLTCNICSVGFDRQYHLKEHMKRLHEGVKYPCDLCAYKANRQQNLKDHKAAVHKIDPYYKCLLCDFCTNHSKLWRRHAQGKHPSCEEEDIFKFTPPTKEINGRRYIR